MKLSDSTERTHLTLAFAAALRATAKVRKWGLPKGSGNSSSSNMRRILKIAPIPMGPSYSLPLRESAKLLNQIRVYVAKEESH